MTAGLPDKSVLNTYGGALVNAYPVANPNTDQDAAAGNQEASDTAGMTRTTTRAWLRFVTAASTGAMSLTSWDAVYGEVISNAAPTLARTSPGVFTVTLPATVTDALAVTHSINIQRVGVNIEGATLYFVQASFAGNVITVYTFTTGFSANDIVGATVHVWVG